MFSLSKQKQFSVADSLLSFFSLILFLPTSVRDFIKSSQLSLGRKRANHKLTYIVRYFLIFLLAERARYLTLLILTDKLLKLQKNNKNLKTESISY